MRALKQWSTLTKILISLAVLASLLSFAKFDHCRNANWVTPDVDIHACYSDIPALFSGRALDQHQWAYSSNTNAVEYPVLTGAVMWAIAQVTPSGTDATRNYFDINAILIALLLIGTTLILGRIKPEFAYLLPLSPAVVASLYINWDLWGIITMVLAIYLFDKKKFELSAIALAVSIATKFFPVLLLLPIAFILWRSNKVKVLAKYLLVSSGVWLAINLPVILMTPKGWWRFYQLNLDRPSDWGSIWYSLSILNIDIRSLNYVTLLSLLAVVTAMAIYLLELHQTPTLASVSFILLAGVLCVGKVYSPQYILWLTPLALIALKNKKELFAFWIWQAGEGIYHIAIWQHLAMLSGAQFGLPGVGYALVSILRIATCAYFMTVLIRSSLKDPPPQAQSAHSRLGDFLFEAGASYP